MAGAGIDFGTTNSIAALVPGSGAPVVFAPLETTGPVMPTATYLDREFHCLTGQDAIDRYIEDNSGRKVELVPEVIGEASVLTGHAPAGSRSGPEVSTFKVYGDATEDPGLQGRLFRGLKRLLGDAHTRRLMVFDQPYRLVALITPVLLRIRRGLDDTANACGLDPATLSLRVGHPIHFEGRDPLRDRTALTRLEESCHHAGLRGVAFYPEPVAATLSWRETASADLRGTALTLDFGGGTMDLSLLRFDGDAFEILGTGGLPLGGDHIDQLLFRELLFPLLGKGERWRRQGEERVIETAFPFERYEELLLNWAVTYTLNQNRFRAPVVECMQLPGEAGRRFRRLNELITRNFGYLVFQYLREAKVALSERDSVVIDIPELDLQLELTRVAFEAMLAPMLGRIGDAVDALLREAGVAAGAVDVVVRTGGSSLIPAVRQLLDARFPGRVVDHDPFRSVAHGLALAAQRDLRFRGAAS